MNEDEIADKVYEERERIVDLYRNGPGDGTIIDPADDPAFNDYHKLDRFGFIWYAFISSGHIGAVLFSNFCFIA